MMLTLRPYQQQAVDAVYAFLRERSDNPVVVAPTASGKTPIMATICKDSVARWSGRVLILAHVKELLEQSVEKLRLACPDLDVGIHSAGLGRRDTEQSVIVAGIQSVYRNACDLGAFNLILIDECHLLPEHGEGMYRRFLADMQAINPEVRVVGFTATPFRMKSGLICRPDHFLNDVCYEIGIPELIDQGYLCPLTTVRSPQPIDTSDLKVSHGEFAASDAERLMDSNGRVDAACAEIVTLTANRNSVLIFAAGIKHARHIIQVLAEQDDIECGFVCGQTPDGERDATLKRFRGGELKYLCNVGVLTTGFDAPNIDCVVLLRPTMSPGLYSQMVGRGFRLHPNKADCLVLDFGGNVLRHGPVDLIQAEVKTRKPGTAPLKQCPECEIWFATGYRECPDCRFVFPEPEKVQHDTKPTEAGILSKHFTDTRYEVQDVTYSEHVKRGAAPAAPHTFRVDYRLGLNHWQSEFVCLEHTGNARCLAVHWWRQRSSEPVPDTVAEAVLIALDGGIRETNAITVRSTPGARFDDVVGHELGEMPDLTPRPFEPAAHDKGLPF